MFTCQNAPVHVRAAAGPRIVSSVALATGFLASFAIVRFYPPSYHFYLSLPQTPQSLPLVLLTTPACSSQGVLPPLRGCPTAAPTTTSTVPWRTFLAPVLVGFVLLCLGFVYVWRRMHARTSSLSDRLLETQHAVLEYRRAWEITEADVELYECIGEGAVGRVFRGRWRDMPVAVKRVHGEWLSADDIRREVDREASVLHAVRHPNIVQFLGAGVGNDGAPFLVTELLGGTLTALLDTRTLSWDERVRLALDTARGMALVHSLGRMHRDLKSSNILIAIVAGEVRAKISDFGTATLAGIASAATVTITQGTDFSSPHAHSRTMTTCVGTPLWMAPEVLNGRPYGPPADVYSFAIVMWELAAQTQPWGHVRGVLMHALRERTLAGERPDIDPRWPEGYVAIMREAWATEPSDRPPFSVAVSRLALFL
jgi:hypothetical protein